MHGHCVVVYGPAIVCSKIGLHRFGGNLTNIQQTLEVPSSRWMSYHYTAVLFLFAFLPFWWLTCFPKVEYGGTLRHSHCSLMLDVLICL